eukprot:11499130-Ditylum_brightwellii.AAC.1
MFPDVFNKVILNTPSPILKYVTKDIIEWNEEILQYSLHALQNIYNKHIVPTVMCPQGCSEFIFKCASYPADTMFQQYLKKHEIKLIDKESLNKVTWSCNDYIHDEEDYDAWLMNPDWMVQPAIAFIDNVSFILMYNDYDKGTKDMMIHTCH